MGLFDLGGGGKLGGLLNSKINKVVSNAVSSVMSFVGNLFGGGKNKKSSLINYTYKYKVSSFKVCLPGQKPTKIINEAVSRIMITKLFDKNIHPIFEMLVNLPPKLYQEIIRNKNEVTFILRIQASAYNAKGNKVFTHDFINGVFCIITDDEFEFKDEALYDEANKVGGKTNYNPSEYNTEFLLSLWKDKDIKAMRKVINDVYDNTTLSTVMGKIYSEAGIDKILISPIDNDKSYPKIIIPPINLYDLPKYIETVYGTYYTGTVQFLDYRCMYILSRSGVCDAYEDGEYKRTIFIIKKSNSSMSYNVGTSEDSESKVYYIYTENDNISFSTPSASNDAITGNNVSILDAHGNETTSVEGVGNQRGSGNERVYQDNYGNDFNKTTILADINESNCQATIVLMDYNEEAITPNKEFLIVFEDTKHNKNNGFYRLIGSEVGLVKTGEQLDITGKHTFVYKAPIDQELADKIIASTKIGVKPAEAKTPVEKPTSTDLSGTVPAVPASTPTSGPIPKNIEGTDPTPVSVSNSQTPQRNSNFSYDDLGNVKGVDIPEYNIITSDDDILVTNAKKEAQANLLPCEGPKPKEVNF